MRFFFFLRFLLLLAAIPGITGNAGAQVVPPIVCSATAQPLMVRAEGHSELTGDVVIVCTGGAVPTIGTPLHQVSIAITLSTNITSRILQDSLTEALLFIDDPQPGSQNPCSASDGVCTPLTAGTNGRALDNSGVNRNIFQGVRLSDNTIAFLGVPVNSPGINATRLFRVKNIRAAIAGSSAPGGQIFGYISIFNPPANMQLNNSTVDVAFIQPGVTAALRTRTGGALDFNSSGGSALSQCQNWNADLAASGTARYSGANNSLGGRNLEIRFREAYAGAFKVRDVNPAFVEPGIQQNIPQNNMGAVQPSDVESGFYNTAFPSANGLNRAGRADHGTRLRASFNNVPPNVRVFVSTHALSNSTLAVDGSNRQSGGGETTSYSAAYGVIALPFGQNQSSQTVLANPTSDTERVMGGNAAGYPAGAVPGLIEVPIFDGAGSYTWEVFATSPFEVDTLSFAVSFAYRAGDNPGTGKITMSGGFAPVGGENTMSATAANPRFADQSLSLDAAQVNSCQTTCSFTLGAGTFNAGNTGGSGSVNVVASGPACPWTAASSDAWVTISPPASGVGNGVVTFVVQSNAASLPRSTTLVIGGQTFVVNQSCTFTLSSTSFTMNAGGATASLDVSTQSVCVWSASSNSTWLSISSGSTASGSGRVTFSATVNIGTPRAGSLTVAGQNVTVSQDGTIPATPLRFVPLAPCRLMETRPEYNFQGRTGAFGPPYLTRTEMRILTVPQSNVCQVPATAKAYVLNVTLVPRATGVDFVTVWPAGELRPTFWTVRSPDRQIVANSAIVKAGPNGAIAVYASDDTDML
ncbi:MAG: BACON domain-containing protein, partial [Acidobacteria bacterium]|nr:BACON domain-containing protein [Acidobacteriota bacterium]